MIIGIEKDGVSPSWQFRVWKSKDLSFLEITKIPSSAPPRAPVDHQIETI